MHIIGIDFSTKKPAVCGITDNDLNNPSFSIYPMNMSERCVSSLSSAGIEVIQRKGYAVDDTDSHARYALELANVMADDISSKYPADAYVAFEDFAYSRCDAYSLQLAGYRYVFETKLMERGFHNFHSFSVSHIKKRFANKGNATKEDVIDAFVSIGTDCTFGRMLKDNPNRLKRKTRFVDGVDDIVDSYAVAYTFVKEMEGLWQTE